MASERFTYCRGEDPFPFPPSSSLRPPFSSGHFPFPHALQICLSSHLSLPSHPQLLPKCSERVWGVLQVPPDGPGEPGRQTNFGTLSAKINASGDKKFAHCHQGACRLQTLFFRGAVKTATN